MIGESVTIAVASGMKSWQKVPIGIVPKWVTLDLVPGQVYELLIDLRPGGGLKERQSIALFEFHDPDGKPVPVAPNNFSLGELGHFIYLPAGKTGVFCTRFTVPMSATRTRIGLALWHPDDRARLKVTNMLAVKPVPLAEGGTRALTKIQPAQDGESRVLLGKDVLWFETKTRNDLDLALALDIESHMPDLGTKSAVLWTAFLDQDGVKLESRAPSNKGRLGEYTYLDATSGRQLVSLFPPKFAATVRFGLAAWDADPGVVEVRNTVALRALQDLQVSMTNVGRPEPQSDFSAVLVDSRFTRSSYLPLSGEGRELRLAVQPSMDYRITLRIDGDATSFVTKSGILRVVFLAADGTTLASRTPIKSSDAYGEYIYLDVTASRAYEYDLGTPDECTEVRLLLETFAAPANTIRVQNHIGIRARKVKPSLSVVAAPASSAESGKKRTQRDIKVALLCDEFTYNSFKYEFKPVVITPANWEQEFESARPDIFFCESAWSGVDSVTRPWKGKVYASRNFPAENRNELLAILAYCRRNGIPTVFWNKEDPTHFGDRVHDFVATAKLFDHVFTTDSDLVELYESEHGIKNVGVLPFATQPRIFNPLNSAGRTTDVIFAGSWYGNHLVRSEQMERIFDSIIAAGLPLVIYDRHCGSTDPLHRFPDRYSPYIRPAVTHTELSEVYKSSLFGLNINTVTESPTMFARRVFELMSSNTVVLSNDSVGLRAMFGDNIVIVDDDPDALTSLTDDRIEAIRDENLHVVLSQHTYAQRFAQVLETAGIHYESNSRALTFVALVKDRSEALNAMAATRFYGDLIQTVLLVLDTSVPSERAVEFYTEFNRVGSIVVSKELLLKQKVMPESLIPTDQFVVADVTDMPSKQTLERAMLHVGYISEPIIYRSSKKYRYAQQATVRDVIAPKSFIYKAIMHYGTEIRGSFYHV